MSKRIFKYELETTDIQNVQMPVNSEILCIQTQRDVPCLWALVDESYELVTRTFEIFGTGHYLPQCESRKYIGTYQLQNGNFIFHCFELIK